VGALPPPRRSPPPLAPGGGGFSAPSRRAYTAPPGCPPHIGPLTAASARANAGRNEYAHLREPMTVEDVLNSPVLWDPIRYLETCPSSDGAVALVVASEEAAKKGPRKPAWIKGAASYAEAMWVPGRDQVSPEAGKVCARRVYEQAGIRNPWKEIHTAEIYVPFGWFEEMWLEKLDVLAGGGGRGVSVPR